MATRTAKSRSPTPAAAADQAVQYDKYIERRVNKTRTHVKVVDLAAALMVLLAGTLTYLLVVTVIDHWVVGFTVVGRYLALVALIGVVGYFSARNVLPLIVKRINPVYAARTIEQAAPTLRNSLINYLLFRAKPADVRSVVLDAVREQAADGLSGVSVDVVVDRARVIKVGYVMIALLTICGIYKIFSPKDPWQSVLRVVIPWSDIARPSRVTIEDVQPGDSSAFFGQRVTVTARISGVRDDEPVTLFYTTDDGQTVDREVAMRVPEHELHYHATLPAAEDGIRQGLVYRIEVGDAASSEYRITALTAPSITVRKVHYGFPRYTSKGEETLHHGDIEALEGTRVTVTAEANREIKSAQINITAEDADASGSGSQFVRMTPKRRIAKASFYLPRCPGRHEVERLTYEVRFTAVGDQQGANPVRHLIKVEPDLPPIVELLSPVKAEVDVPEDGEVVIEARAIDPDYALTGVTLRAVSGGGDVVTELLLDAPSGHTGSTIRTHRFVPRELGLHAGQVVDYWVVAEDNRTAFPSGADDPNRSRTMTRKLRIVDATGQGNAQPSGAQSEDGDHSEDGEAGNTDTGDADAGNAAAEQHQPASGEDGEEGPSSEGAAGEGDSGAGGDPSAEGQTGAGEQNPDEQPGAGGQPDQANEEGSAPEDFPPDGEQGAAGQPGDSHQDPGADQREPVASDGSQDGDAVQRILEHMQDGEGDGEMADQPLDEGAEPAPGQQAPEGETDPHEGDAGPGAENSLTGDEGGRTDGAARTDEEDQNPSTDGEQDANPGQGDNGPSGAGREEEGGGTPDAQGDNQQTDKQQRPDDAEGGESPEAHSPSTSPKQSDSSGDEEGDRSGGGGKGGGQPAQQPGNDSAGSSSAADDGAGAADESGEGETSDQGGDGGESDGQTGQSGDSVGAGSSSGAPPDAGESAGGSPGGEEGGDPAAGQQGGEGAGQPADAGPQSSPTAGQPSTEQPTAGGQPGGGQGTDGKHGESSDEAVPDDPNLEYARKATDLVLDYLKDQQQNPDEELLDKLGWKKGDLQRFLRRWDQLRRQSEKDDPQGRRELDDALRSLGVTPRSDQFRQGDDRNDDLSRMRDAGHRTAPPPEYLDQFRAYQKSIAKE